jgi:uncharacterized protein (DUF2252 family)
MAQTPFTFFRGSAIIQARDLMTSSVSGITVQACGDCHLMNFGGFASPERSLIFDINDFDETFPAPFEWDIKRLVASIVLCARERDFSKKDAEAAVRAAVESYRTRMWESAGMKLLDVWYSKITFDDLLDFFKADKDAVKRLGTSKKKAQSRTSEALFPKIATAEGGQLRIVDNPPFIFHFKENIPEFEKKAMEVNKHYAETLRSDTRRLLDHYDHVDVAIKVVGIGSVGTRCLIALWVNEDGDPLILQVKEARRSVLEPPGAKSRFKNQGQRIVDGQRLLQATSDIFLGWAPVRHGHDFYVRQYHDMKISAKPETFLPETLTGYSTMCGWAMARAHAKAGDSKMIAGYLGSNDQFDDAMVVYAKSYADQVERDFANFKKAISSGRLHTDIDESSDFTFLM